MLELGKLSYLSVFMFVKKKLCNTANSRSTAVAAFITTLFVLVIMLFLTPALRTLPM